MMNFRLLIDLFSLTTEIATTERLPLRHALTAALCLRPTLQAEPEQPASWPVAVPITGATTPLQERLRFIDAIDLVDYLLCVVNATDQAHVPAAAAPLEWKIGTLLYECSGDDDDVRALGSLLVLQALQRAPHVFAGVVEQLRPIMAAHAPRLDLPRPHGRCPTAPARGAQRRCTYDRKQHKLYRS